MNASPANAGPGGKARLRNVLRAGGLFSTSIYFNYLWSVLNLGLSKGLRLVGIALCVRQLHLESWGQVVAAAASLSLLALLVSQGLGGLPQIFRVSDRTMDRALLKTICLYRLAVALVVIAILYALRGLFPGVTDLLALYSLILIPMALNFDWLFHRRERYHLALLVNVVKAVVFFALVYGFVRPESTPFSIVRIEIIAEACGLLFSLLLLKRVGLRHSTAGGSIALGTLLLAALPLFLSEAIQVLPATLNVWFLKAYWGFESLGQYDIGARIGLAYFFVGAALVQIIIPKLTRLHETGDPGRMVKILSASSSVLLALGSLFVLVSFYFAPELARFLFGRDYPQTVFVFRWISVWVYASFMTMLNTIVLLSMGRRREYLYGALLSSAGNVLATWILVAQYSVAGAVFGRILSEGLFYVYALVRMPRGIRAGYAAGMRAQIVLLAALIGVYLASDHLTRPVALGVSLAFCAVVFWRRGVFSRETLAVLRAH